VLLGIGKPFFPTFPELGEMKVGYQQNRQGNGLRHVTFAACAGPIAKRKKKGS